MTQYNVFGPYDVPVELKVATKKRVSKRIVNRQTSPEEEANGIVGLSSWWGQEERSRLRSCTGCYVFAIRAGKGYTPWYVGKTSRLTFEKEAFTPRNVDMMNDVLAAGKGTLVLFLISTGRAKTNDKHVDEIETWLIGQALVANAELKNVQKTKKPEWVIGGLKCPGKKAQTGPAAELARTLNLTNSKKKA